MISDSIYEKTIAYMIDNGMLCRDNFSSYEEMFISEFNHFKYLYENGEILKLYEILRANSNEFFRIAFAYHHRIDPHKVKSDLIRRVLKETFDFESGE